MNNNLHLPFFYNNFAQILKRDKQYEKISIRISISADVYNIMF